MKKLRINAIALALGFAFSAGSMAEAIPIPRDVYQKGQDSIAAEHSSVNADATTQVKTADAHALAIENSAKAPSQDAAHKDGAEAKWDAIYEVAKETCNTRLGAAKDHCLAEMKMGFGRL